MPAINTDWRCSSPESAPSSIEQPEIGGVPRGDRPGAARPARRTPCLRGRRHARPGRSRLLLGLALWLSLSGSFASVAAALAGGQVASPAQMSASGAHEAVAAWDAWARRVERQREATRLARLRVDPAAVYASETRYAATLASLADSLPRLSLGAVPPAAGPAVRFLLRQLLMTRDPDLIVWLDRVWLSASDALDPQGEIRFWLGLALLETGSPERAAQLLAGPAPPAVRRYAEWLRVLALEGSDSLKAGEAALALVAYHPHHPFIGSLTVRAARHAEREGRDDLARRLLLRYLEASPGVTRTDRALRAEAATLLAEAERRAGRQRSFRTWFCRAVAEDPGAQGASALRCSQARTLLAAGRRAGQLPDSVALRAVEALACAGPAGEAWQAWSADPTRWTPRAAGRVARLVLDALYRARRHAPALAAAEQVQSLAQGERAAVDERTARYAALIEARLWRRRGALDAMAAAGARAAPPGPAQEAEREIGALAVWEVARELEDAGRWDAAATWYADLAARYPAAPDAREARLRVALCRARSGEEAWARAELETLCAEAAPNETSGPCLWRALRWPQHERDAYLERAAAERYPGYFAYRARGALGLGAAAPDSLFWRALRGTIRAPERWGWPRALTRDGELAPRPAERRLLDLIAAHPGAETALLLLIYGRDVWARGFLARLPGWAALSRAERAGVQRALGDLSGAIYTGIASGDPHARYPVAFAPEVAAAAARFDLAPEFLLAVIRQESLFSRTVRSGAGAVGLMQLMPRTAARMADSLGWDSYDLARPRDNIFLGARHLVELLTACEGEVPVALAAYNGGLENARRWRPRGASLDEFIELIGYSETRRFVKSVLMHYGYYGELYPAAAPGARQED